MSLRLGARLAAVLLPTVALLAPSIAHAEKVVSDDIVGDVQQTDLADESADAPAFTPAPDETSTDIVRTVAAYGDTRLSVTVHFRDLLNTRYQETYVKILTPRGAYVVAAARFPGTRVRTAISRGSGRDVECRGLRAKFAGGADTIALSVPSSCLDEARWVRLGVGAIGFDLPEEEAEVPDAFVIFADDGHRGTIRDTSIGKGPKVHRG